jgi:tetratricopeptide (TPR) repeat protein
MDTLKRIQLENRRDALLAELRIPERVAPSAGEAAAGLDEWVAAIVAANLDRASFYISKRPRIPPPSPLAWVPAGGLWKLDAHAPLEIDAHDWEYSYRNANPFAMRPERAHAPKRVMDPATGRPGVQRVTYSSEIRLFHLQASKYLGDRHLAHDEYEPALKAYEDLFAQEPGIAIPDLLFSYGKALFAVDRSREALPWLERALPGLGPARADQFYSLVRQLAPQFWSEQEPALRKSGLLRRPMPP